MSDKNTGFVSTEWLNEHLEDENLRIIDATTFLQIPKEGGYYDVWSGQEEYDKEHIPGAVFADLKNNFLMRMHHTILRSSHMMSL